MELLRARFGRSAHSSRPRRRPEVRCRKRKPWQVQWFGPKTPYLSTDISICLFIHLISHTILCVHIYVLFMYICMYKISLYDYEGYILGAPNSSK